MRIWRLGLEPSGNNLQGSSRVDVFVSWLRRVSPVSDDILTGHRALTAMQVDRGRPAVELIAVALSLSTIVNVTIQGLAL